MIDKADAVESDTLPSALHWLASEACDDIEAAFAAAADAAALAGAGELAGRMHDHARKPLNVGSAERLKRLFLDCNSAAATLTAQHRRIQELEEALWPNAKAGPA